MKKNSGCLIDLSICLGFMYGLCALSCSVLMFFSMLDGQFPVLVWFAMVSVFVAIPCAHNAVYHLVTLPRKVKEEIQNIQKTEDGKDLYNYDDALRCWCIRMILKRRSQDVVLGVVKHINPSMVEEIRSFCEELKRQKKIDNKNQKANRKLFFELKSMGVLDNPDVNLSRPIQIPSDQDSEFEEDLMHANYGIRTVALCNMPVLFTQFDFCLEPERLLFFKILVHNPVHKEFLLYSGGLFYLAKAIVSKDGKETALAVWYIAPSDVLNVVRKAAKANYSSIPLPYQKTIKQDNTEVYELLKNINHEQYMKKLLSKGFRHPRVKRAYEQFKNGEISEGLYYRIKSAF